MISSGRNQGVLILSAVVSFFIIAEIVISSAGTANPAPEDKAIAITGAWRGVRKKQRDIQPVRHSGQVLCLQSGKQYNKNTLRVNADGNFQGTLQQACGGRTAQ